MMTGTVKGSDGRLLTSFSIETLNPSGGTVNLVNVTNGQWMIEPVAGYSYWFQGLPNYGGVNIYAAAITQGMQVVLPANFDAPVFTSPTVSQNGMNVYYTIAGGLGLLLILSELKNKKKSVGKIEMKEVMPIVLIGAGLLSFDLIKKLLTSVGIWDSAATKNLDAVSTSANTFWSPNYYTQFSSYSYAIDTSQATALANQIYNAFGMFNDDEDAVFAVFRTLKTKSNVSFLAKVFSDVYHQDLLTFLRGGSWPQDRLSDADVNTINSFLNQLPTN